MPSLFPDYRIHDSETSRLLQLCGTLTILPSTHQKLVAEIILLRLFSLFENFVSSVAEKLACDTTYFDGSSPLLLMQASASRNARTLFQTYGRSRPRNQLMWSKAAEIKKNTKYVIDPNDNFSRVIDRNGNLIDELRRVRNRIAHNNAQSRKNYKEIVRRYYGAYMNHVTPGVLLLTPRMKPRLIEQYIRQARILAKDIVKA